MPPRRRYTQSPIVEKIQLQEAKGKEKKSSWNLIDVFGRTNATKESAGQKKSKLICNALVPFTKNRNIPLVTKSRSEHCSIDLMANKQNSFSTPDLTNIVDATQRAVDDVDDVDLDIMDIERSNSLNCSANHSFLTSRPSPPMNISSNILWSHNLSSTLVSTHDPSGINLVGANVNDYYLREDVSGYCRMAPIIRNKSPTEKSVNGLELSECKPKDSMSISHLIDNSGYCHMRPMIDQLSNKQTTNNRINVNQNDLLKNITFDRNYDVDDETISISDENFSLLSIDKTNSNRQCADENSSSGVSSDEGNVHTSISFSSFSIGMNHSMDDDEQNKIIEHDDTISLARTDSPGTPDRSLSNSFCSTKLDEKYPSYFPNDCLSTPTTNTPKRSSLYQRQNTKNNSTEAHIKRNNWKTVINKATPAKVQKQKYGKNSIENICTENSSQLMQQQKMKSIAMRKTVLCDVDANSRAEIIQLRSSTSSTSTSISSPLLRNIKSATLSSRVKTPSSSPCHCDKRSTIGKSISFVNVDTASALPSPCDGQNKCTEGAQSAGIMRFASLSRFKIDLSPWKAKFNNILQRPNVEI